MTGSLRNKRVSNFEVQKMNVGVAGFMSGSVKSIKERLGGSEYHAFHRGGANHIA